MDFNSILIVDDHPIVQAGLKALVKKHCVNATVRCATTVADALKMLAASKTDLLIADMQMPDGTALDIKKKYDGKTIIYTMHEEPWIVGEMVSANVDAIVLKGEDSEELIVAIDKVEEGKKYFSNRFAKIAKDAAQNAPSKREKEILAEICEGKTSQAIAEELCLSTSTVNFHKKKMMAKSNTENIVQLVAKFLRGGWMPIVVAMMATLMACQGNGEGMQGEASVTDSLRVMVEEANAESNHERALALADSALNITAEKDTNTAHLLYEKGLALFFMEKNEEALLPLGEAIDILDNYDKPEDAAIFRSTLGVMLRRLGRDQEALDVYTTAATMAKKIKDPSVSANIYNNVAVAYVIAKREKEAMAYLQQAEKLGIEANDSLEIYSARSTIADLLLKEGKYDKVIETMRPTVDTLIAHDETMLTVRCASCLLSAYASTKRIADADKLLKDIEPMLKALPEGHLSVVGIEQARASLLEIKGQYAEALAIYERLAKMPSPIKTDIFKHIATCYAKQGLFSKAMAMQDSAYAALELMKEKDLEKQMSEFSIKYKTSEKELQISKLKEEKAEQTAWFMAILAVIIVVAFIVVVWLTIRRKQRLHQREMESKQRYIDGLEDERARLARELHDGVCNDLLGIGLTIDAGGEMDNLMSEWTEINQCKTYSIMYLTGRKTVAVACLLAAMSMASCASRYKLASVERSRVLIDSRFDRELSNDVEQFMAHYSHAIDSLTQPLVGRLAKDMSAHRPESELSNLLADIMVWAGKDYGEQPDMGIYNMGGIRASMSKGDVTFGNVLDVAPFENKICFLTLTGESLMRLFENIAAVGGEGVSSGVRMTITSDRKLKSVTLGGKAIDPKANYRIATIDYLAHGNDRLVAFVEKTDFNSPQDSSNDTRFIITNYFKEMMSKGIVVDANIEGRIVVEE